MFFGPAVLFVLIGVAYVDGGSVFWGVALAVLGVAWPFLYIARERFHRHLRMRRPVAYM